MKQYSSEIAKMNSAQNMSNSMGMCMYMCYSSALQKVISI